MDEEELKPGDRAPSERDLAARYGVSRMTARQALQALEQDGVLRRVQGLGSFVARSKISESLPHLVGFSEDMRLRGLVPSTEVLSIREELPTRSLAGELSIPVGAALLRLRRRSVDAGGLPVEYVVALYRADRRMFQVDLQRTEAAKGGTPGG